jgi:hypothetical protein
MTRQRARSNRRLLKAAAQTRDLATDLRRQAAELGKGDAEDRDTASWLNELANHLYRGTDALPLPDTVTLERAARVSAYLDQYTGDVVAQLREQGLSWQRIGYALGMSDEGARKRYSPTVKGESR